MLQADIQRRILLEEHAELVASGSSPERLETVNDHLNAIDADGAPARAAQLLSNLGFSETLAKRPMEALSGGCEFGLLYLLLTSSCLRMLFYSYFLFPLWRVLVYFSTIEFTKSLHTMN